MQGSQPNPFPETSWGLVTRATGVDDSTRREALSELCERYWPPLYTFVRYRGRSPQDAEDLTQGFITELLEKDTLERADPERGRLRTFLLGAFKRYLSKRQRDSTRLKRSAPTFSIDQEVGEWHFQAIPAGTLTPEALFDRQWLQLLLDRVLRQLGSQYEKQQKSERFDVLKDFLDESRDSSYKEAAAALSMSEGAVRVAVHRLMRQYRALLESEVGLTLGEGEDAGQELLQLVSLSS